MFPKKKKRNGFIKFILEKMSKDPSIKNLCDGVQKFSALWNELTYEEKLSYKNPNEPRAFSVQRQTGRMGSETKCFAETNGSFDETSDASMSSSKASSSIVPGIRIHPHFQKFQKLRLKPTKFIPFEDVLYQKKLFDDQREAQIAELERIIPLDMENNMNGFNLKLVTIYVNWYYVNENLDHIPAEIALATFSISDGIVDNFTTFVDPGQCGLSYDISLNARTSSNYFNIPCPPFCQECRNYAGIVENMTKYLQKYKIEGEVYLFIHPVQHIEPTIQGLNWLWNQAGNEGDVPWIFFPYSLLIKRLMELASSNYLNRLLSPNHPKVMLSIVPFTGESSSDQSFEQDRKAMNYREAYKFRLEISKAIHKLDKLLVKPELWKHHEPHVDQKWQTEEQKLFGKLISDLNLEKTSKIVLNESLIAEIEGIEEYKLDQNGLFKDFTPYFNNDGILQHRISNGILEDIHAGEVFAHSLLINSGHLEDIACPHHMINIDRVDYCPLQWINRNIINLLEFVLPYFHMDPIQGKHIPLQNRIDERKKRRNMTMSNGHCVHWDLDGFLPNAVPPTRKNPSSSSSSVISWTFSELEEFEEMLKGGCEEFLHYESSYSNASSSDSVTSNEHYNSSYYSTVTESLEEEDAKSVNISVKIDSGPSILKLQSKQYSFSS